MGWDWEKEGSMEAMRSRVVGGRSVVRFPF